MSLFLVKTSVSVSVSTIHTYHTTMSFSSSSPPPYTLNVVGSDSSSSSSSSSSSHFPSAFQNLNTSILIIVIVLAVTLTVSLSLCLFLRHLTLRRRSPPHTSPTTAATTTTTSSRRVSPELPPSSLIDSLPTFTFSSVTRRPSAAASAADCAVCLSKFEHRDILRLLPLCCHAFHIECIDTWLHSNLTCPLCRSPIISADHDVLKLLHSPAITSGGGGGGSGSFRLDIGNVSRGGAGDVSAAARERSGSRSRSYSVGSFEYLIEEELNFEVPYSHARNRSVGENKDEVAAAAREEILAGDVAAREERLAGEVAAGSGRSWLKEYVDRLSSSISSRTVSFRGSGRFFAGGGSHRSDAGVSVEDFDLEAMRLGEEISETFRWLSGV